MTYRWGGHFIGDPEQYRSKEEVALWRERCPIRSFQRRLLDAGMVQEGEIDEISSRLEREISAAVQFAEESPLPDPEEALQDLFASSAGT